MLGSILARAREIATHMTKPAESAVAATDLVEDFARCGVLSDPRPAAGQLAKCASLMCSATRNALAATVRLGLMPLLDGKNDASTT